MMCMHDYLHGLWVLYICTWRSEQGMYMMYWLLHQPGKITNIVHDIIMYLHSLFTCFFIFITEKNVISQLDILSYISSISTTNQSCHRIKVEPFYILDTFRTNISVLVTGVSSFQTWWNGVLYMHIHKHNHNRTYSLLMRTFIL